MAFQDDISNFLNQAKQGASNFFQQNVAPTVQNVGQAIAQAPQAAESFGARLYTALNQPMQQPQLPGGTSLLQDFQKPMPQQTPLPNFQPFLPTPTTGSVYDKILQPFANYQQGVQNYAQNRIMEPAQQAGLKLQQPGLLNKAQGALGAFGAGFNATPLGIGLNLMTGAGAGALHALRTGEPLGQDIGTGITSNVSPTGYATGSTNPILNTIGDIAVASPEGTANALKAGIGTTAKGLFGSASKMHYEDTYYLDRATDALRGPKVAPEAKAQAVKIIDDLAGKYLNQTQIDSVNGDSSRLVKLLQKRAEGSPNRLGDQTIPGLGLVDQSASKPTAPITPPEFAPAAPIVAPKKAGVLSQLLDRTRNVIGAQGPAGSELAAKLQQSRDLAETSAGDWVSRMPTVRNLNSNEFKNFVDVAEGHAQPISPKVAQAATEWGQIRGEVYNAAKSTGLDIGKLENYFPHRYDPKMFEGDNFVKGVQHLVQTGQASTNDEAAQMMRYAQDTIRNRTHGNLEAERTVNLPGYEKTKDALFGYLDSASNRIAQVKTLGPGDSIAMGLINRIGQEGGDAQAAKQAFDVAAGAKKYGQFANALSGKLRGLQSVGKLGLGAITNLGQSTNTAIVAGGLRTLTSGFKAFTPEAKAFALKSGVTLDGVLQDLREGQGFSGKVLSKLTAPGFNAVEKFNRTVAAWAGKGYAEDLAKSASSGNTGAIKQLAKMGIRDFQNGALSEADQIKAARNIVERTQFKVDPQDLPGWAASPFGKLLTQFKSFSYNQSAFFGREILAPIKQGNVAPLMRFLVIGSLVGEGIGDAKAALRNRQRPSDLVGRGLDNLNTVGGAGLVQDAYNAISRGPDGVMQFIAGPTGGDVSKIAGGAGLATQGKPKTLGKAILGNVPVVGQTISNTLMPPKNTYKARTPDLPIDTASAAETNPSPVATNELEKAKIKQQIADLNKKEKAVVQGGSPVILPIVGQITGTSDQQKNQKLQVLVGQEKALQDQLKAPKSPLPAETAKYSLEADRALKASDQSAWNTATNTYVNQLGNYQSTLNPSTDQAQIDSLQKKIEDLKAQQGKSQQPAYEAQLTGNPTLDKLEIQKENASISAKMKTIQTLYDSGQISADEASKQISDLQSQKFGRGTGAVSGVTRMAVRRAITGLKAKPKAAKKISYKAPSVPKIGLARTPKALRFQGKPLAFKASPFAYKVAALKR